MKLSTQIVLGLLALSCFSGCALGHGCDLPSSRCSSDDGGGALNIPSLGGGDISAPEQGPDGDPTDAEAICEEGKAAGGAGGLGGQAAQEETGCVEQK